MPQTSTSPHRDSIFEENGGCILSAKFHLKRGDSAAIKARMDELMQKRIDKQPLDKPAPAAPSSGRWDVCGCPHRPVRPAGLSATAVLPSARSTGGFVVNLGGATCADVLALCDEVRAVVKEKTGYDLEKEIRVVKA